VTKTDESATEMSVEGAIDREIETYSMAESGLTLQATFAGTKYRIDDELN